MATKKAKITDEGRAQELLDTLNALDSGKTLTQAEKDAIGTGGGTSWGGITGTLSSQADLQLALDAKADDGDVITAIVGLSDVTGAPAEGDVGVWRSGVVAWEPKPEGGINPALNDVTGVTITTPGDSALLAYDSTAAAWINQTAAEAGLALTLHTHALADISDAGTAAGAATTDFATAAQGATADTALQPADSTAFATAAQGAAADTALQPGDAIISDPDPDPVKGESALINMVEVTREAHDTRVANGDLMDDKTYWIIEETV